MEKGVLLAQELQLPRVIFELDALTVIQAINDKATGNNFGHFNQEIHQARDTFKTCAFKHLGRDHNRVAHELAQYACRSESSLIWKGVTPLPPPPQMVSSLIQSNLCNHLL